MSACATYFAVRRAMIHNPLLGSLSEVLLEYSLSDVRLESSVADIESQKATVLVALTGRGRLSRADMDSVGVLQHVCFV